VILRINLCGMPLQPGEVARKALMAGSRLGQPCRVGYLFHDDGDVLVCYRDFLIAAGWIVPSLLLQSLKDHNKHNYHTVPQMRPLVLPSPSAPSSALASCRSAVSNPSVNQV
jgi:hypothetical protein